MYRPYFQSHGILLGLDRGVNANVASSAIVIGVAVGIGSVVYWEQFSTRPQNHVSPLKPDDKNSKDLDA